VQRDAWVTLHPLEMCLQAHEASPHTMPMQRRAAQRVPQPAGGPESRTRLDDFGRVLGASYGQGKALRELPLHRDDRTAIPCDSAPGLRMLPEKSV